MSKEKAQQFIERLMMDSAFQEKLRGNADNFQAVIQTAKDAGYDFSAEEFVTASVLRWLNAAHGLSESDLEKVAGGSGTQSAAGACYTQSGGIECGNVTTTDPLSGTGTTTSTQTYAGNRNLNKGGKN